MKYGESALMRAARRGRTDIVVKLVEEGADTNMQNIVSYLFLHVTLYV